MTFRTDVEPLKLLRCQAFVVSDDRTLAFITDEHEDDSVCVSYEEALALRDWLNRVLDSYPAREGWKMVPVEPTEEMLVAAHVADLLGCDVDVVDEREFYEPIYKAMLAAAPEGAP